MEEIKIGLQVVIVTTIVLIIAYKLCAIIGFHTQKLWRNDKPETMTEDLYACWGVTMLLGLSVLCAMIIGITYGIGYYIMAISEMKEMIVLSVGCLVIIGLFAIWWITSPSPSQEK